MLSARGIERDSLGKRMMMKRMIAKHIARLVLRAAAGRTLPGFACALVACIFVLSGCSHRNPETTARRYCEAVNTGDANLLKSLFEKRSQKNAAQCASMFFRCQVNNQHKVVEQCQVESISPPYAVISCRWREGSCTNSLPKLLVLYLLHDGQIKYDSIFLAHPALALRFVLQEMASEDLNFRQAASKFIRLWKVPALDFAPDGPVDERAKSVQRFRDWIDKNEATFDPYGDERIPALPIELDRLSKADPSLNADAITNTSANAQAE